MVQAFLMVYFWFFAISFIVGLLTLDSIGHIFATACLTAVVGATVTMLIVAPHMKEREAENAVNEITITAEDGREVFHYEGNAGVESNLEENYIKLISEDGNEYTVYYDDNDSISITNH